MNINRYWADLLIEELVRCGVSFFCLAPGSRSTPLVQAIAAHPEAQHFIHYDERGTAFCALGYGRATGRPAAWITTSGTALANGFPAIIEASVDIVPMLLLTADRPPELRQTGANQTIDQVKLFGDYPRWFFDLPAPTLEVDPAFVLTTVDQAVYKATRSPAGPVHLNCMFREPLASASNSPPDVESEGLQHWRQGTEPFTRYTARPLKAEFSELAWLKREIDACTKGIVVAGRLASQGEGEAVLKIAEQLQWPLLADIGSQIRLGSKSHPVSIGSHDLLLSDARFRGRHRPDLVLQFGGRVTSKRVAQFLSESAPVSNIVVKENPGRFDPDHCVKYRVEGHVGFVCDALREVSGDRKASEWLGSWQRASRQATTVLDAFFAQQQQLTEPHIARLITLHIPEHHALVLSSSMPVREVDSFGVEDGAAVFVAANRGASGIDGLVAMAAGVSSTRKGVVTLLIGDLALLHDLNSLALLKQFPVILVVVNNDGGGIFHFLPIVRQQDVFEPLFGTPHGLRFEAAAAMFGLAYHNPHTASGFETVYRDACERGASAIIEVKTDRGENVALHQQLIQIVQEALA